MSEQPEKKTELTILKIEEQEVPVEYRELDSEKTISVPEHKLKLLIDQKKELEQRILEYEASEDKIAQCCLKALNVFGLINKDTGEVVDELKQNDGVMSVIFSAIKDNLNLTDMMFRKQKFEKEMSEKFGFFKDLGPIFENYAKRKRQ